MRHSQASCFAGLTIAVVILLVPMAASAQGVLFVVDDKVGIGTSSPNAVLELAPPSGNAAFRLNFSGQSTWTIANTGDIVTFNKIGSGGQETTMRTRLDGSGGLPTFEVQGSVKGTKFINSSSRELKTNFTPVVYRDVLTQLAEVPVSAWNYKSDMLEERHVGPVAEDFQAAFGLGDGKTITSIDMNGVTLAAIKALHEMVLEQDSQIDQLRAEIEALQQQMGQDSVIEARQTEAP